MRLFAAVDPPAAEVTALSATLGERDGRVRWVGEHQWHVTLAFYGEVPEAVVAGLQERLARAAARTAPFSLRLAGGGSFPRQARRARQVWVGLDGDLPALHRLAERCVAVGRREGLDLPDRPYRPHLTLGRARGDTVDATDLVTRLSSYAGALAGHVVPPGEEHPRPLGGPLIPAGVRPAILELSERHQA